MQGTDNHILSIDHDVDSLLAVADPTTAESSGAVPVA
jgi:hypothetical protein